MVESIQTTSFYLHVSNKVFIDNLRWHTLTNKMSGKTDNMTLTEIIRVMLRTVGLPNLLWVEAVKTTCYVVNRSPSTAIGLKTLMEM